MRVHPEVKVRINVACQSSRKGGTPQLITIHDTEGANVPHSSRDLRGLGEFFDRPATEASSHVATDEDGTSARYVSDSRKAWTQAFYNPWCLSIEMIGFAHQSWASKSKEPQLWETARWIAHWSKEHNIPIRRGRVTRDGRITRTGVIQHRSLGNLGGGHVDVSETFPMTKLLNMAREIRKRLD